MKARRAHARYARRLKVKVVSDGESVVCVSRNLSLGGMFLITETPLRYGSEVQLVFQLPALNKKVSVDGVVRWQSRDGMGVQFSSLRAKETWALNELFRESELVSEDTGQHPTV